MLQRVASYLEWVALQFHSIGTLVMLPAMVLLVTTDVILRYFFNAPLVWGQEVNSLLLFMFMFLVFSYTWSVKGHISMDILYYRFGRRLRAAADAVSALAGMLFVGLMALQGFRDIPYMLATHESSDELRIVFWPFKLLMALCCSLLFLQLLTYLALSCTKLVRVEDKKWN